MKTDHRTFATFLAAGFFEVDFFVTVSLVLVTIESLETVMFVVSAARFILPFPTDISYLPP
mgnify:CR=1 FL=1